jgi:hypothetical protein
LRRAEEKERSCSENFILELLRIDVADQRPSKYSHPELELYPSDRTPRDYAKYSGPETHGNRTGLSHVGGCSVTPQNLGGRPRLAYDNQISTDSMICHEMKVKSIDLLKSYFRSLRSLSVAVRVVDPKKQPVLGARVHLMTTGPEGRISKVSECTDHEGFALFQFANMGSGEWEITITDVTHPQYILSKCGSEMRRAAFL